MTLITTQRPGMPPVLLQEMKEQVRVKHDDEDLLLQSCIESAVAHVESYTRLRLITQKVVFRCDGLGGCIRLPVWPVQQIESITYIDEAGDEQALNSSLYRLRRSVKPYEIIPAYQATWPTVRSEPDTVAIEMTVGFGDDASDVDAGLLAAVRSLAAHFYANREAVLIGVSAVEMPLGVRAMLDPHVFWV